MSPGGEPKPSPVFEPTMIRFSKMRPGLLLGPPRRRGAASRMSTVPLLPNVVISRPVRASICAQAVVGGEDQAPVGAIGALPVGEAALGRLLGGRPELFAGRGVERDHDILRAGHVHHVVDDERVEREPDGVAGYADRTRRAASCLTLRFVHRARARSTASSRRIRRSRSSSCMANPGCAPRREASAVPRALRPSLPESATAERLE